MGPKPGPSGWAQAGPKPEMWDPKNQKNKNSQIKIRVAQNVGKVWISRKKIILAPLGAIWAHFLRGLGKSKKCKKNAPIFLGGPMGPIHPVWANGPGWGAAALIFLALFSHVCLRN